MKYRPDIDGLRAIAVLPVLFFHAEIWPFTGGFVGVDVFFVISGFLITSIIYNDISLGQFSIISFYNRRIRRIFPALIATILASSVAAAYILLPKDFDAYGQSVVATALSASNILFWWDDGYFAAASETKPLLHTWSLAVEEQFYLVFPIIILALRKYLRWAPAALAVLAASSFAVSVWSVSEAPEAGFFLLPARAWELMIGALLALDVLPAIRREHLRDMASAVGIFLIAVSVFSYSGTTAFPGVAALLPCVGAALIIHAGTSGPTHVGRILSTPPFVFVGLISYSLYLWHWPIIVFSRYVNVAPLNPWETTGVVVVSFLAAIGSYALIERPFRRPTSSPIRTIQWGVTAVGTVGLAGVAIASSNGWPSRFDAATLRYIAMLNPERYYSLYQRGACFLDFDPRSPKYNPQACLPETSSNQPKPRILLWGDSFAASLYPGLKSVLADSGAAVGQYTGASCRPYAGAKGRCGEMYKAFPRILASFEPMDVIIIAGLWSKSVAAQGGEKIAAGLADSIKLAKEHSKKVVLVGQSPMFSFAVAKVPVFNTATRSADRVYMPTDTVRLRNLNAFLASVAEANGASFYDPLADGCKDAQCLVMLNGEPLHWDFGHMTMPGSAFYAKHLAKMLNLPPMTLGAAAE